MRVEIKFGKDTHTIELESDTATVGDLKAKIQAATGVLPALQKLLGKGNIAKSADGDVLTAVGVKDGTKLMLIGSTAEKVVEANAPVGAEKEKEATRERRLRSLPQQFWLLPAYAGFLADPFVAGRGEPLEGGGAEMALLPLDIILSRINKLGASSSNPASTSAQLLLALGQQGAAQVSHRFLTDLPAAHRTAIQKAHAVVRGCFNFTAKAAHVVKPDEVLAVLEECMQILEALPLGEWAMIPSGWLGMKSYNILYLLVHRDAGESYSLVVVDRGLEGQDYHPQWQTADKLKSCPYFRLDKIARDRLMDKTFWLVLLSLWMRRNDPENRSEFIRAEVFYDALLPWLVEKDPNESRNSSVRRYATDLFLHAPNTAVGARADAATTTGIPATAVATTHTAGPFSEFISTHGASLPTSASSAIKSAITAFCFLLEQYGGMTRRDIKHIKFVLKYEFFLRAAEDLSRYARRFLTPMSASSPPQRAPAVSAEEHAIQEAVAGLTALGVTAAATEVTLQDIFAEVTRQRIVIKSAKNVILTEKHFADKLVLVYVGGYQFPDGKQVANLLADATPALLKASTLTDTHGRPRAPPVELLFLSCDAEQDEYDAQCRLFTFPRATFPCVELLKTLDLSDIPALLLFGTDGQLMHREGVAALRLDPEAALFPEGPWRGAVPLTATDVRLLEAGAAQLAHHTKKRVDSGALDTDTAAHVVRLTEAVEKVVAALPKDNVHDLIQHTNTVDDGAAAGHTAALQRLNGGETAAADEAASVDEALQAHVAVTETGFENSDLLPLASTLAYYGKLYESTVPSLEPIDKMRTATSLQELFTILKRSQKVVETLWARAGHSSTASRVAVQMHIIEFITWVFSTLVPVPFGGGAGEGSSRSAEPCRIPPEEAGITATFYHTDSFDNVTVDSAATAEAADPPDAQLEMLKAIHYLMLSYANGWQAVETPTRSFDAERCLIAMSMLLVFDGVLRQTRGSKKVHLIAHLVASSEGGYYPSTSLGRRTTPFATVAAGLELTRPHLLPLRSAVLRYIDYLPTRYNHEFFDFQMPDKLELRKGGYTVLFLRTALDNAGFTLEESGGLLGANASEMEKLMEWLCSPRTPLAREHPAFIMLRDMVLLAKFMGTMEVRDAQLLHRRKELDPFASWRLSFEEDTPGRQMSAGWRTRPAPPKWECVMVRGRDTDIADIAVKGFGDRELLFGEGPTLQSPIDVSRLLEVDHPTEDDVLHAKALPTFGGTMNTEEAEVVLSCLTTPYVRIPLLLDFFSSQDRNTYLFVPEVQRLLHAVLFEPAAYASTEQLAEADPRSVPMRLNAQQRQEVERRRQRGDLTQQNYERYLGTTYGLLLNEIIHAPSAVLRPLERILESIKELGPSSVYSANASYVLFVVGLTCDVLGFARWVLEKRLCEQSQLLRAFHQSLLTFLDEVVCPLVQEWLGEADSNEDTPTQCVLYSYRAMIERALWKGRPYYDNTPAAAVKPVDAAVHVTRFLQSCAFVRARHGFGMGMQRTQLAAQEGDDLLTPEEKMIRFLQAQGLDTSRVSKEMLEQGKQLMMSGGRRRAVFVQIRSRTYNDTVRVPALFHSDASSTTDSKRIKLPPADVPENVFFAFLLEDHLDITAFMDKLAPAARNRVFRGILQTVLRDHAGGDDDDDGTANATESQQPPRPLRRQRLPSAAVSTRASAVNLDRMDLPAERAVADTASPADAAAAQSWTAEAPGVYRGPANSGLLFHAQTCELFWRNDELKPVPDSMSHFTDFENILGKEILQCGQVSRHMHRHWVHIVGTPYDVVEWAPPADLRDQGVHHPLIITGNFPKEMVESALFEGVTYDRIVPIGVDDPWNVREERWAVDLLRDLLSAAFPSGMKSYPLAPALEKPASAEDEEARDLLAPPRVNPAHAHVMRFLLCDSPQYEDEYERSTWKEFVAYHYPQPRIDVFNLVPHARKLYRSLVFSTNQRYCLHSLATLTGMREKSALRQTAFMAGELKRRVQLESSLEIHRYNEAIHGREMYIPARLLQGIVPSALLESFFFWQGQDHVLRGYPLSGESALASVAATQRQSVEGTKNVPNDGGATQKSEALDHWFDYGVEVYLSAGDHSQCLVVRRNDKSYTPIAPSTTKAATTAKSRLLHRGPDYEADLPKDASAVAEVVARTEHQASQLALLQSAFPHLAPEVCEMLYTQHHGDVVNAIQWAASPSNTEALQAMVLKHLMGGESGSGDDSSTTSVAEKAAQRRRQATASTRGVTAYVPNTEKDLVLVNMLHCRALAPILQICTSIEDCSHVLVWGRVVTSADDAALTDEQAVVVTQAIPSGTSTDTVAAQKLQVVSVEMPRLRAKFYVQRDGSASSSSASPDGTGSRLRLYLADQPGWRLAEPDDVTEDWRASLRQLQDPFQQCAVLCNATHDVALLVPNHDFMPMKIRGDPFNPLLLFDRSSFTWRESVPSPFYLYTVHSSHAFLVPSTLSASLYYAVMQCATQHYAGALRTLDACYTDCMLSPEEAFMFALFERTMVDQYPDAHAVRLKLAHAVQYSHNEYRWPLAEEMEQYLRKKRHVSADCQLRRQELVDLLKRCSKALPMVRSQLELYAGWLKAHHKTGAPTANVVVKTPTLDRCGFPWERLLLYPWEKIAPQKLQRLTYQAERNESFCEEELVKFLWGDTFLGDEETGANAKKGFYFLYAMKKGAVEPKLCGQDVGVVLSQLLSRWFHLRHARWGREAAADGGGEADFAPSWCATVLQLMELFPSAAWPAVFDPTERFLTARGVNLNVHDPAAINAALFDDGQSRPRQSSSLPDAFQAMNRLARELFNGHATAQREARQASIHRTPDQQACTVAMHDHIVSRVLAHNAGVASLTLREDDLSTAFFANGTVGQRRATLRALMTEPLAELGLHNADGLITTLNRLADAHHNEEADEKAGVRDEDKKLPFELRAHHLARPPLAQNMLDRLEEDSARFADQQRTTVRYALSCLNTEAVNGIAGLPMPANASRTAAELTAGAMTALQACEAQLQHLSDSDTHTVRALTASILACANASPTEPVASSGEQKTAEGSEAARAHHTRWLEHRLRRTDKTRVPVTIEWLCGGLLSTQFESELDEVNPFHGSTSTLRAELALLMLLSNRSYFAAQSAMAIRQIGLMLELCALLRDGPSDGDDVSAYAERTRELVQLFSVEVDPGDLQSILDHHTAGSETAPTLSHPRDTPLPAHVATILAGRLQQLCSAALDLLTAKRHYAQALTQQVSAEGDNEENEHGKTDAYELDPRFLVFECLFNILLRERQVAMVRWFVENIRNGQSRVQQMIMGQGKTTVVGPLLALILADGTQLITQVMPTALLEQTRGILRRCFSVVLVKHIFTVSFDRNFEDDAEGGGVELLYQKLRSAEENGSVVIAAPECIKSLFLKAVEQMHIIDSTDTADLNLETSADERHASHAGVLRKRTMARSSMADAITPILELWQRGVLIMDEVDVLLHPLRSELNFPIGLKYPIDMSGPRWMLPIHLLDAIFLLQRGRTSEDVQRQLQLSTSAAAVVLDSTNSAQEEEEDSPEPPEAQDPRRMAILAAIRQKVASGFERRALQREPHLVLLDTVYYETELLPALVPWVQLWVHENLLQHMHKSERVGFALADLNQFIAHTTEFLNQAEKQDASDSATSEYLNTHVPAYGIKLLNLAHDWLHRLLPHVLSKIDRVSFGILQPGDLAAMMSTDVEKMPFSRKMMAVPFVAKDVPSRSSEFAHPDVVIGLTVLAFRYEGLRPQDVRELIQQLKQDFSRQAGPKEHRPAAKLYKHWMRLSAADRARCTQTDATHALIGGSPLDPQQQLLEKKAAERPTLRASRSVASLRRLQEVSEEEKRAASSSTATRDDAAADAAPTEADAALLSFERAGVPLSQLQVADRAQMSSLHHILSRVPEVIHYYLCSCIFPRTMNFQRLKISACGHELGSSMLFTKRIGFSGTPSNLLPIDLGECYYEPGSDGRVLSVLTNKQVVQADMLPNDWSPLQVLDRIASARPPYSALIDAGALITNMDNEEVARYLLARLPSALFDGVVFLDNRDRQMILQRDNGLIVPVAQCGVSLSRRFTFFDQVHTTGTDVKQSSTAVAAITIGKDLVFRDYAQGAYRMRGIGKGQRLCLFLIPEVVSRIRDVLGPLRTGEMLRDVPAWLLLNSMRVEGLQFFKLSLQELANVWRKKALRNLMSDSIYANRHPDLFNNYLRCRRFQIPRPATSTHDEEATGREANPNAATKDLPSLPIMRTSIEEFREVIEYPVDTLIAAPKAFLAHLDQIVEDKPKDLIENDPASQALIQQLMDRMTTSVKAAHEATEAAAAGGDGGGAAVDRAQATMDLNAEIVHEQEAEEEQEQEAEQEEQRMSAFSRDDEYQIPWSVDTLRTAGGGPQESLAPSHGSCFYQLNAFQVRAQQPHLRVSPTYLLSDNYFRLAWHGVGERRLRNALLFLEWVPLTTLGFKSAAATPVTAVNEEDEASPATLTAATTSTTESGHWSDRNTDVRAGLVTLAEAESLRWLMHHSRHARGALSMGLRFVSTGHYMDATALFASMVPREGVRRLTRRVPAAAAVATATLTLEQRVVTDGAALLFRFFNNDMFFSPTQLQVLERVLAQMPPEDRLQFFVECLRVHRRQRNHWEDTPIAVLFVEEHEREHLRQMAVFKRVELMLGEMRDTVQKASAQGPVSNKSALRKEADTVLEHVDRFTSVLAVRAMASAEQSSEELSTVAEKANERHRAVSSASASSSQPPVGLSLTSETLVSLSDVAAALLEVFAKFLSGLSPYDVEQALAFGFTKALSTPSTTAMTRSDSAPLVTRVTIQQMYQLLPSLDPHGLLQPTGSAGAPASTTTTTATSASSEPWHCEACTYLNDPTSSSCAICSTRRPAGHDGAPHGAAEEEQEEDSPWPCPTCTFINDSRRQPLCSVCMAPNPSPLVDKESHSAAAAASPDAALGWDVPEGYWVCSVEHGGCSKFNPNAVFYCQVCEKARPNLASVRF